MQKKSIRKIIFLIVSVILILLFFIIFIKNNYKKLEMGNNMSNKNIEEFEEYILNLSSYEAKVSVTVQSNKNINEYVLIQKYKSPNLSKQIVLEPSNIEGLEISYDGYKIKINNTKLKLNTVYENYEYIANNSLCLEAFIEDYKKNNGKIYEKDEKIILETETKQGNNYIYNKKLYLNKKDGTPSKLLIEDINGKNIVYILYNEIKLNNLKEEDLLAFKTIKSNAILY